MPEARPAAFLDACALAGAMKRNLLLSLAEAGLYRPRWSAIVMDETERAVTGILAARGAPDPSGHAARARHAVERAFPEAAVDDFLAFLPLAAAWPDPGDAHVVAAAVAARVDIVVSDDRAGFPVTRLTGLGLEIRSTDRFLAELISRHPDPARDAIERMRLRFRRPELDAAALLAAIRSSGLVQTADQVSAHRPL